MGGEAGAVALRGIRRLVGYCMAAVAPGKIVILDEPTNDVDPLRRRLLWREIRSPADSGTAVLLITHNVLEAERAVDALAIIDKGRVVGTGTPSSLKGQEAGPLWVALCSGLWENYPASRFDGRSQTKA